MYSNCGKTLQVLRRFIAGAMEPTTSLEQELQGFRGYHVELMPCKALMLYTLQQLNSIVQLFLQMVMFTLGVLGVVVV